MKRQRGFILIYVVAMVAALTIVLHQLNQLRTAVPRQVERQVESQVRGREAMLLLDHVVNGTVGQKLPLDPRYSKFRRLLAEDPARLSEMDDALGQLKIILDALNFKIDVPGSTGSKSTADPLAAEAEVPLFEVRREAYKLKLGEREYRIVVESDNARPDLNALRFEPLRRYLVHLGIPATEAPEIAANLIDWRDRDSFRSEGIGAESEYYQGLARPYPPRNGFFRNWQELVYVKGITPDRLALIRANFSIRASGSGRVLPDHLSVEALAALAGLNPEIVRAILREYGRLGDAETKKTAEENRTVLDVAEILLTPDAAAFDQVVGLVAAHEGLRIEISSEGVTLTADYALKDKRLIGVW